MIVLDGLIMLAFGLAWRGRSGIAAFLPAWLLEERPTPRRWAAGGLIEAGVMLMRA
ncbi:MAG TPA: hypothetical protein VGB04_14925 [Allosphingosinicella sp.]